MYIGTYLNLKANGQIDNKMMYNQNLTHLSSIYKDVFHEVMRIISLKMAKPEEVLIVIDEDGTPVRE